MTDWENQVFRFQDCGDAKQAKGAEMKESEKSNLAALADAYAEAKDDLSVLETRVAELRAEILKTGYSAIPGTRCRVTVETKIFRKLSQDLVAERLSGEDFEACKRPSVVQMVRVKKR